MADFLHTALRIVELCLLLSLVAACATVVRFIFWMSDEQAAQLWDAAKKHIKQTLKLKR